MKDKLEILKSFGLQLKEVESNVYKVINTMDIINVDKLQWELKECILITSLEIGTEKLDSGIYTMLAHVYYIILNYTDVEKAYVYDDLATTEFGDTLLKPYRFSSQDNFSIDTIYRKDEV